MPLIKYLHIALAYVTVVGFIARGALALADSPLRSAAWIRISPHVIDTLLLMRPASWAASARSFVMPRPPVVMTKNEVKRVLAEMQGIHLLMAKMLYGPGLRLMECIRLRVHDLDFERNLVYVRAAKGGKDRTTIFPKSIQEEMKKQLGVQPIFFHDEEWQRMILDLKSGSLGSFLKPVNLDHP